MAKKLEPLPNVTVLVTKAGATVNGSQQGLLSSITVDGGARQNFANNDVVQASGDMNQVARVNGTPSSDTEIPIDPVSLTLLDGQRIVNLGSDGLSGGTPDYDGADAKVAIYEDPAKNEAIADNKLTTNADGEYGYYPATAGYYDESVLDENGQLGGNSQTIEDVQIGQLGMEAVRYVDGSEYPMTEVGLQAALDAGGDVILGSGTINVATGLTIGSSTRLRGQGRHSILKRTADISSVITNSDTTNGNSTVSLQDLVVDVDEAGIAGATAGYGIKLDKCSNVLIRDVQVDDYQTAGIFLNGSTVRASVRDCLLSDGGKTGVTAYGILVEEPTAANSSDIIIERNVIESDQSPPHTFGVGLGGNVGLSDRVMVRNNVCDDAGSAFCQVDAGQPMVYDNWLSGVLHDQVYTFTDGDTTPSVSGGRVFATANTGATTITNLDGGVNGQRVDILVGDGVTTFDFTASGLKGNGGLDYGAASGDLLSFVRAGNSWHAHISKVS